MANQRKRISELPALNVATLDTTFVLGISGSTTYKISINNLTSSLDGAFATDLVTNALSSSLNSKLSTSSFNSYTASAINGTISGSSQLTSSFDQRYVISGSITQTTWDNIANKPAGIVSQSTDLSSLNTFTASISTASLVNRLNTIESVSGSWITESETGSFLTSLNGAISSSSQLTSSYDTRYTLSGSVQPLPSNLVSSSAQITALGFISSSQTIDTSSFATTGSNSFSGSQTITGSLIVSSVAVVAGALTIPSASVISLTSGSSISVDASGAITGSLTGSVFGIGDVVAFSASLNSRIISGSAVAGTISGSSQLTSSFDSRYVLESETGSLQTSITNLNTFTASQSTASLVTSISNLNSFTQSFSTSVDSRFDTLEATIISGSPNYTQVLGNQRNGINVAGTSIISGSITTTGNPVQIIVTGDANPTSGGGLWCSLQLFRDGNGIGGVIQVEAANNNENQAYCLNVIDTPPAGTYTYSLRVPTISGTFQFGEASGPLLTAVELKTNTNLPSTNNVFTGTNTFNNIVTIGASSGAEGGELRLAYAETGNTLTGNAASIDIYQNRLRIFEGGGNARGAHLDLSKLPEGVAGELMWKVSGFVNAGTFVTLDNLKCTVTTSGNRGLSVGAVSTNFTANVSGWIAWAGGGGATSAVNVSYTTTASTSAFNWSFTTEGDGSYYTIVDKTNNRVYRVTLMIGASYLNNFISIERLF